MYTFGQFWTKILKNGYCDFRKQTQAKTLFLWKNMHQSMSRNWENSSSMLQSSPKYFISIELNKSFTVVKYVCGFQIPTQRIPGTLWLFQKQQSIATQYSIGNHRGVSSTYFPFHFLALFSTRTVSQMATHFWCNFAAPQKR